MAWSTGIIVLLVVVGTVLGDTNELDLEDLEKKIQEIPIPGLENGESIPAIEDVEKMLKEKCEKNGGENAFNNLQDQKSFIQECVQNNINVTEAQAELEEAKKTGSMDEVFAKYCKRIPQYMECITNVTEAARPCLEDKEKDSLNIILNVTESLLTFMCYKDGDRIAMFVAEGGIECLEERKEGLQNCLNKTVSGHVPADLNSNSLPLLLFEAQECKSYDELQTCSVEELEKCKDNTPANIVDAVFKFIRRITPCKNFTKSAPLVLNSGDNASSSSTFHISFVTLLIATFIAKYV